MGCAGAAVSPTAAPRCAPALTAVSSLSMQVKQSDIVLTMLLSCGDKLLQPMSLPGVCCCLFHATVCVCVSGEQRPAVEASHGLFECYLRAELHDPDCYHALRGQQQGEGCSCRINPSCRDARHSSREMSSAGKFIV